MSFGGGVIYGKLRFFKISLSYAKGPSKGLQVRGEVELFLQFWPFLHIFTQKTSIFGKTA